MSTTLVSPPTSELASDAGQFTCLPLSVFRIQRSASVNLYCKLDTDAYPVLYRSPSIPITERDIEDLRRRGHRPPVCGLRRLCRLWEQSH